MAKVVSELDLSEFAAARTLPTRRCWFQRLDKDQSEKVAAAHAAGYSYRDIAVVVSRWGMSIGASGVSRHFGGSCTCG